MNAVGGRGSKWETVCPQLAVLKVVLARSWVLVRNADHQVPACTRLRALGKAHTGFLISSQGCPCEPRRTMKAVTQVICHPRGHLGLWAVTGLRCPLQRLPLCGPWRWREPGQGRGAVECSHRLLRVHRLRREVKLVEELSFGKIIFFFLKIKGLGVQLTGRDLPTLPWVQKKEKKKKR